MTRAKKPRPEPSALSRMLGVMKAAGFGGLPPHVVRDIASALGDLSVALADRHYVWTSKETRLLDRALAELDVPLPATPPEPSHEEHVRAYMRNKRHLTATEASMNCAAARAQEDGQRARPLPLPLPDHFDAWCTRCLNDETFPPVSRPPIVPFDSEQWIRDWSRHVFECKRSLGRVWSAAGGEDAAFEDAWWRLTVGKSRREIELSCSDGCANPGRDKP